MIDQFKRRTVLNKAADLILEPDRWTKGALTSKIGDTRAYCAIGAIRYVMYDPDNWRHQTHPEREVLDLLERRELIEYNDLAPDAQHVAKQLRKLAAELP